MQKIKNFISVFSIIIFSILILPGCRDRSADSGRPFVIAIDGKFTTLDPIGSTTISANDERLRTIIFNSLVKKDEQFEYVGDLAKTIAESDAGATLTFTLQDNVKFHNGKVLDSGDVKYTLDKLLETNGAKASAFYDSAPAETKPEKSANGNSTATNAAPPEAKKIPQITSIETPDAKTVIIKISRPTLKRQLLANLVPVSIVPAGSDVGTQTSAQKPPSGTGPYKLISFDQVQNVVEVEKFADYWEGAPKIEKIQIKALPDTNALLAELKSGIVDLAPGVSNLTPDSIQNLKQDANLQVKDFKGSNIQYLGFNTETAPLDNVKVRQAIGYAVNREKIISDSLSGLARPAYSILPEESWAFNAGTKYDFNPEKAKQLLEEAGFKAAGDGKRQIPKIVYKISSGNPAVSLYAQIIQNQLAAVGIPIEIESLEGQTMRSQLQRGQYQMTSGIWVGGNQDPIFLRDLFASSEIPNDKRASRNRSRYSNPEVDKLLEQAFNATDRPTAEINYKQAQDIISRDVPMLPLWYPANIIVANKRVGNIIMNASGDWDFIRDLTL